MSKAGLTARTSLLLALTMVAAACGGGGGDDGGKAGGKPEYKIGFMGDLTGATALLVVGGEKGARLAVKQANASGDLPITLRLQAEDTGGDKDKAVSLANKLAANDKVLGVVGPAFSGESFSAGPIFQQAGIPQVTQTATNPGLAQQGWKAWFRGLGNDNSQGGPAPDIMLNYLQGKKVFVAHDKTAYGEGLATIVRDGVRQKNAAGLVGFEAIDPGKEDYSAIASKIVSSGADVLFWGAYSPEGGKIITQARDKGFKGKYLGGDGSKEDNFVTTAKTAAEGAYALCPCADVTVSDDPVAKEFLSDYKKEFNQDPIVYSGEGYDAARLILESVRKAGKPSGDIRAYREKVTEGIRSVKDFKGTTKSYTFKPDGELVESSVTIFLYRVEGGKFKLVGKADDLLKGPPAA
ncbi:MAG: branched-chain amino acid ABC transporter substrate-binding protein [Actinomycetota bacterium]